MDAREGAPVTFTLDGWQKPPQLHAAFQRIAELFPVQLIEPAAARTPLPARHRVLEDVPLWHPHTGSELTLGRLLASTETDGWAVAHRGMLVDEQYFGGMTSATRHLMMSVSKSLVGVVAGVLCDIDALHPNDLVTDHVPDLLGTGYTGATVRHVLDMRSGTHFSEEYLDPDAEVRLLEQAIGWAPRTRPVPDTLYGFLATLRADRPHGGAYAYRSCETDVLGWVCEAASGRRMSHLVSELVWQPIGAEHLADIAVDRVGAGMHDGGISGTVRDLLRFGSVFLDDGVAWSGQRVLSPAWIESTLSGETDSAMVFAAGADAPWMPGGMYRNQIWFPSERRDVLVCLGIHGQMVYIDRSAQMVAVKLSSWPTPQDALRLFGTLAAMDAIARSLRE